MKNKLPKAWRTGLRFFFTIAIILGVALFWLLRPVRETTFETPGFTPLRNDKLAREYAPLFLPHTLYGAPLKIFYRMARAENGALHVAYHPFFAEEENPHAGLGAALSRYIYTGGLNLKTMMFGPADLELVELILDANGKINEVHYEDAKNYRPNAFGVEHIARTAVNPPLPLCFAVKTWNHMVEHEKPAACKTTTQLPVEYFAETDWQHYRMVKQTEAILRRNRAHRLYERKVSN